MNIKNRIKTIACACACVLSIGAFADYADWFSGGVDTTQNPNILKALEASWSVVSLPTDGSIKIEDGKIVLENDIESALVLTPKAPLGEDATKIVEVTATAVLTPSDVDDLPKNIDGAKTGFAVARDADGNLGYYGYSSTGWTLLTGATPAAATDDVYPETTFTVVLNYRDGTASFKVGTTALTGTITLPENTTALTSVDTFGTGTLTSIDANYELGAYIVDGEAYASLEDVPADKREQATLDDAGLTKIVQKIDKFADATQAAGLVAFMNGKVKPAGTDVAGAINTWLGETAGNDFTHFENYALGIENEDTTFKAVPTADALTENIKLAISGVTPKAGFTVTYNVKQTGVTEPVATSTDATDIRIPLKTGTYTVEAVVK